MNKNICQSYSLIHLFLLITFFHLFLRCLNHYESKYFDAILYTFSLSFFLVFFCFYVPETKRMIHDLRFSIKKANNKKIVIFILIANIFINIHFLYDSFMLILFVISSSIVSLKINLFKLFSGFIDKSVLTSLEKSKNFYWNIENFDHFFQINKSGDLRLKFYTKYSDLYFEYDNERFEKDDIKEIIELLDINIFDITKEQIEIYKMYKY